MPGCACPEARARSAAASTTAAVAHGAMLWRVHGRRRHGRSSGLIRSTNTCSYLIEPIGSTAPSILGLCWVHNQCLAASTMCARGCVKPQHYNSLPPVRAPFRRERCEWSVLSTVGVSRIGRQTAEVLWATHVLVRVAHDGASSGAARRTAPSGDAAGQDLDPYGSTGYFMTATKHLGMDAKRPAPMGWRG